MVGFSKNRFRRSLSNFEGRKFLRPKERFLPKSLCSSRYRFHGVPSRLASDSGSVCEVPGDFSHLAFAQGPICGGTRGPRPHSIQWGSGLRWGGRGPRPPSSRAGSDLERVRGRRPRIFRLGSGLGRVGGHGRVACDRCSAFQGGGKGSSAAYRLLGIRSVGASGPWPLIVRLGSGLMVAGVLWPLCIRWGYGLGGEGRGGNSFSRFLDAPPLVVFRISLPYLFKGSWERGRGALRWPPLSGF